VGLDVQCTASSAADVGGDNRVNVCGEATFGFWWHGHGSGGGGGRGGNFVGHRGKAAAAAAAVAPA
jgi:hypothetical protein